MRLLVVSFDANDEEHSSVKNANYELYGVSHHMGTMYGGHYIAEVKDKSGKWYRCNDSHVTAISSPDTQSSSAYVVFYRRRS